MNTSSMDSAWNRKKSNFFRLIDLPEGLDEWQLAAKVQELVQKLFRVGAGMVGPRHPWRCSGMIGSSLHF